MGIKLMDMLHLPRKSLVTQHGIKKGRLFWTQGLCYPNSYWVKSERMLQYHFVFQRILLDSVLKSVLRGAEIQMVVQLFQT